MNTPRPGSSLQPHPWLKRSGPVLVCVLDGVGIGPGDAWDAWSVAKTPVLDRLRTIAGRSRTLRAHGRAVGLPSDDDMGNSEVGHNALGCGRIVRQGAALVDAALKDGSIFQARGFLDVEKAVSQGGTLHLLGLLSDGGVHSRLDQLLALCTGAADRGARKLRLHLLTDGRDVPEQSSLIYVDAVEEHLAKLRTQGVDARIASGGGRMFVTMDRYEADWSIVERGWHTHVLGRARGFASAREAIETYRREDDASDQFLPPFVVVDNEGGDAVPCGPIVDGDAVICFNYRGDRVLEISRAFDAPDGDFAPFHRERVPRVTYAGMMEYDGDLHIPKRYLVDPPLIERTSGELLAEAGVRTFAVAETHKFGHVTYFWNGNRSGCFDDEFETYVEVQSDLGPIDQAPAMKAREVGAKVIEALGSGKFDQVRVNLANGDMVGHTGDLAATIEACQVTDEVLGQMLAAVDAAKGSFIVTADHGNADDMALRKKDGTPQQKDGEVVPRTSHTLAPVPFCVGGAGLDDRVRLRSDLDAAGLPNVTATFLNLLGFEAPEGWEPSLIEDEGGSAIPSGSG